MRTALLMLALLITLCVPSALAQDENYDIRKLRWGMTLDEVKMAEGRNSPYTLPTKYTLFRKENILNQDVNVCYVFNPLTMGLKDVIFFYENKEIADDVFDLLATYLVGKYKEVSVTALSKDFRGRSRQFEKNRSGIVLYLYQKDSAAFSRETTLRYFDNTHGKAWTKEEARREQEAAQINRELQQF